MDVFCITTNNPQFQKLLAESGEKQGVFAMTISKWMTQNEVYDRYPTLQELGITVMESIKPGVEELFDSNLELANAVYEALGFKSKPDVILPIGTSGSGKSTFIKSLPQENLVVIEPDAMRVEFTGNMNDKSRDKEIYEEAAKRAITAIKQGKQVVFDTTNLTKDKRLPFIEAIKKTIPTANIQYKLMELNPELAKQRIKADITAGKNRANVPDSSIDRQAQSYNQMLEDIKSESISNFDLTPQQKQQAQQLYSQYLDNVFPDSKVKDILYHTNTRGRIEFFNSERGLFVTPTWELAKTYKPGLYGKRFQLLINSKNIQEVSEETIMDGKKQSGDTLMYSEPDYTEYVVFEPEQIHILGSKQDIEGFKDFAGSVEDKASESGLSLSSDEAAAYNSLVNDGTIPIKCK